MLTFQIQRNNCSAEPPNTDQHIDSHFECVSISTKAVFLVADYVTFGGGSKLPKPTYILLYREVISL